MAKPLFTVNNAKTLAKTLAENASLDASLQKKSHQEFLQLIVRNAGYDSVGAASSDAKQQEILVSFLGNSTEETEESGYPVLTGFGGKEYWDVEYLTERDGSEVVEGGLQFLSQSDQDLLYSYLREDMAYIVKINGKVGVLFEEEHSCQEAYRGQNLFSEEEVDELPLRAEVVSQMIDKVEQHADHYFALGARPAVMEGNEDITAFGTACLWVFLPLSPFMPKVSSFSKVTYDIAYK